MIYPYGFGGYGLYFLVALPALLLLPQVTAE